MCQNEETVIGEIIHNIFSVEWMRYNMFSMNDAYRNIPILVFRLNESDREEHVKKLEDCVAGFEGRNAWKVFKDPLSRKGNYLLTLAFMENMRRECFEKNIVYNERGYLGNDRYILYCEQAIQDIPFLAEHIAKCFK